MAINHAVIIPTTDNTPNPSGDLFALDQPGPSVDNLLQCAYPCTMEGHTDTVSLLWCADQGFSLPDAEANDPNFGSVAIVYNPPLE